MRVLKMVTLSSLLAIGWSAGVSAQAIESQEEEPTGVSPATEIQLRDITPTIRDIVVQLQGTEKEEKHLKAVQNLVNQILATSKPKIVRVPIEESASPLPDIGKQGDKVTITLSLQPVVEDEQHYELNVTLQEGETEAGIVESFDYTPEKMETLQQQLKTFLFERLNLQSVTQRFPPPTQTVEPSTEESREPETLPVTETQDEIPPEADPIVTSPAEEIQLRNLTPPIKDVSISLRGTKKEQSVLKTIQNRVNEILNNAKVAVVRVPTTEVPTATPVSKVYEALEIVISVLAPSDADKPYKINIALQEKGSEEGKFKVFDYSSEKPEVFQTQLRDYLYEQMNLQPK